MIAGLALDEVEQCPLFDAGFDSANLLEGDVETVFGQQSLGCVGRGGPQVVGSSPGTDWTRAGQISEICETLSPPDSEISPLAGVQCVCSRVE